MPVIWFSSGAATVCSSVSAEAPGYTACTVTTGGAISGYCAIGRLSTAASPASTMKMDTTAAKMGRSMKNRENMGLLLGRGFGCFGLCFGNPHRGARPEAHHAVDDHALARLEPARDDPGLPRPFAGLDRARLGLAFFIDDVDELSLRPFQHRALRHGDRVGARRAAQDDAHELAGLERAAGVGKLGARLARAGGGRDAHVGEVEPPGFLVQAAVCAAQRHLEIAVWQRELLRLHFLLDLRLLVVGNAEVDPDRVVLGDAGEQGIRARNT